MTDTAAELGVGTESEAESQLHERKGSPEHINRIISDCDVFKGEAQASE